MIEIPYRGETIAMPIHLYSTDGRYECRPVLMAGVDTFKMDFHPWCLAFTMNATGKQRQYTLAMIESGILRGHTPDLLLVQRKIWSDLHGDMQSVAEPK